MNWTSTAAILLALAVILGAFGAHGLRPRLDADSMRVYETAVMYHFLHALGILILSVLPRTGTVSAVSYTHLDRKSTRLNSSHVRTSRMPSSA